MSKDALNRVAKFTAAEKKRAKTNKKSIKKLDKRSKLSPKQKVRKAQDKIEDRLDRLAKKYKVSIKLNRNKNKLPSVIVTGLKKLAYNDVAKLFSEIPNSSPVPQKMTENGALFRIFTKRKMTAFDEPQFVVTAKKNGQRLYWTDTGFKQVKASEASILDEETADKIERRSKAKGWDSKTVPATMTAAEVPDDAITYTLKVNDGEGSLWSLLDFIRKQGEVGHSISFKIDEESFGFDGDGADKIYSLSKGNSVEADDGESADNYEEDSDDDGENYEDDEGESDEEADANKADMVKFINDNNISRESLYSIGDRASEEYIKDLKENGPIEDLVGFIYDILGADEAKTALRALVNKKSMQEG